MFLIPTRGDTRRTRGLTLVELILVMVIIAIVALIAFATINNLREKMRTAECISNLKSIHLALDNYVKDNGQWPQQPWDLEGGEEVLWEWWIETMEPYGVERKHWLCPVEKAAIVSGGGVIPEFYTSYIPATFDAVAITPYRWNQPWLLERGAFHPEGPFIIMPSGEVKPMSGFTIPSQ